MTQPEPLEVSTGLNVLHLFGTITASVDRSRLQAACEQVTGAGGLLVPVAVLGSGVEKTRTLVSSSMENSLMPLP